MKFNTTNKSVLNEPWLIKLFNWEYWPSQAFYFPLIPYFIWLAIKSRHPCFFTATNPGIKAGGIGLESKFATIQKIPAAYRPNTILVKKGALPQDIVSQLAVNKLQFPLIVKPNIGFRGLLVKKVEDFSALIDYLKKYPIDFIIQEFLDYSEEVGIMYYRTPGRNAGVISSITLKEFLKVKGDGRSRVRDLISDDPRAKLQLERIQIDHFEVLDHIPEKGEFVHLGIVGNHSKGTRFINGNDLIDDQLVYVFDQLSAQIDGFYYGRFDIKCDGIASMKQGEGFKIMELNGVCSEPTHIYDASRTSYLSSVVDIKRHWGVVQKIGVAMHKEGILYWKPWTMIAALLELRRYTRRIKKMSLS